MIALFVIAPVLSVVVNQVATGSKNHKKESSYD
jgi:hypothetical protein